MNQTQRKYAQERISQIERAAITALTQKHTTPGVCLSSRQRADLIRSGKVKLRRDCRTVSLYLDVVDAFDFSPYEKREVVDEQLEVDVDHLRREADIARDTIVLCSPEDAATALQEFDRKHRPVVKKAARWSLRLRRLLWLQPKRVF